MDDLNQTVADLAARVRLLEDEREIGRVLTRYGLSVDLGDADATAELDTDDTVMISGRHRSSGAPMARDNSCSTTVTKPSWAGALTPWAHSSST